MERIAAQVRAQRAALRLTQQQLADKAGTTQPRISEIESGDANTTITVLDRVARELGLTVTLHPIAA